MLESFQTTFAVPMTCEGCAKDISKSLSKVEGSILSIAWDNRAPRRIPFTWTNATYNLGIHKVEANVKDQIVLIEGTAPPSSIVAAIQSTGRDAILRGSGTANTSAVCILETHSTAISNKIRGLVRMVQVESNMTMVDLTVNGVSPGRYWATVRQTGDISEGARSTGGIWEAVKAKVLGGLDTKATEPRGVFGSVDVNEKGQGNVFLDRPVAVWELIGRSMVLSKTKEGPFKPEDPDTLVGVIARSAGVWDNDKTVCSCSGKNVWQERAELVSQGMV